MTLEIMGLERSDGDQGCIFPVLGADGKRRRICGEPTPILDQSGNKRAFCSHHWKMINEWVKQRRRENKRGDKRDQKQLLIKRYQMHKNII